MPEQDSLNKNQNKRDESFDAFRGLAIIAVVAIHVIGNIEHEMFQTTIWNINSIVIYRQVLNFAVPAFIFISGYWAAQKKTGTREEYKIFLTQKLLRITFPYILWSLIIIYYESFYSHNEYTYKKIMFKFLTGTTIGPYYFIPLIAQFYVLTPIFKSISRKKYGLLLVLIINITSLSFIYIIKLYYKLSLPWQTYALPFITWSIFYEIGIKARNKKNKQCIKYKNIAVVILISLAASILETKYILGVYNNESFAISAIKITSFIYSTYVIFGFLALRDKIKCWPNLLIILGNYSFGIYLIHALIIEIIITPIKKSDLILPISSLQKQYQFFAYQLLEITITLLICCSIIYVFKKIFPKKILRYILGI